MDERSTNHSSENDEDDEPYVGLNGEEAFLASLENNGSINGTEEADKEPDLEANLQPNLQPNLGLNVESNLEPTILADNEHSILCNPENPKIELHALFPDVDSFRKSLRQFAIIKEFEYRTEKSDKKRFIARCKDSNCAWRIRAYRLRDDNKTFKITVLPHKHTCPSTSMQPGKMVTKSWVSDRAGDWIRKNPHIEAKEVQNKLEDTYKVKLSYNKSWRGRAAALEGLQGSWEKSFELVYNFKAELEKNCEGSIVEVDCEPDGTKMRFSKMFVALKPCIDGFLGGCRPYLAIDSTHLTGRYRGQLAAACAIDGFSWLYPVAYGVFDLETSENWMWFMTQLKKAIGELPLLVISSDACKGLENVVSAVFPNAEHRECMRHLGDNFKKRFRGEVYDKNFKPASYAYTTEKCEYHLEEIKKASVTAFNYLDRKQLWCRSKFSELSKVDYVTNNIAESFNNWIKDFKDLHVPELLNQIRRRIMMTFDRRRLVGRKIDGLVVPSVIKELNEKSRKLGRPSICRGGDNCAEVSGTDSNGDAWTYAVELERRSCTCGEWQISGKPCGHAVAFISSIRGARLEDYVHEYFSVERFRMAYVGVIRPIGDKSKWAKFDPGFTVSPPKMKRPAGRPRKERIPGCLELGMRKQQCKRCYQFGHQARTCKESDEGVRNRNRKRKRRVGTQVESTIA